MYIIGDIHAEFEVYSKYTELYDRSIQLGDFGIGFRPAPIIPKERGNHKFFVGNHDNREMANQLPNCLGDYGAFTVDGNPWFFVSGGLSIDKHFRTEGVDWWRDEELSIAELQHAIDLYEIVKPTVMLSHEPPAAVARMMSSFEVKSRTGQALNGMLGIHKPAVWLFGHMHKSWSWDVFQCLTICEVVKVTGTKVEIIQQPTAIRT